MSGTANPLTVLGLSRSRAERLLRQPTAIAALRRYYGLLYHPDVTHDPADTARLAEFNQALDEITNPDKLRYWIAQDAPQDSGQKQAAFYRKALEDYRKNREIAEVRMASTILSLADIVRSNLELLATSQKAAHSAQNLSSAYYQVRQRYRQAMGKLLGRECLRSQGEWRFLLGKELLLASQSNANPVRGWKDRVQVIEQLHTSSHIACLHLQELGSRVSLQQGKPDLSTIEQTKRSTRYELTRLGRPNDSFYLIGSLHETAAQAIRVHSAVTTNAPNYDELVFNLQSHLLPGYYPVGAYLKWVGNLPKVWAFYVFRRVDYICEPLSSLPIS